MSEVMLIWINMWAVPYLVPLQVMFTQNSKKQNKLRKLLLKSGKSIKIIIQMNIFLWVLS